MADKHDDSGAAPADQDDNSAAPAAAAEAGTAQARGDGLAPDLDDSDMEAMLEAELSGGDDDDDEASDEAGDDEPQDDTGADEDDAEGDDDSGDEGAGDEAGDDEADEANEDEDDGGGDEADDSGDDAETVPKGMEDWPKPAVKRIQKQSEQIRQLTAQAANAITLNPSAANPLSHTKTAEEVDAMVQQAKQVRDWVNANPDGGTVDLAGGATLELSPEDAAERSRKRESDGVVHLNLVDEI